MGPKITGEVTPEQTSGRHDRRVPAWRRGWSDPAAVKRASHVGWNGKTMHHPAFRIGEIKRGRS